MFRKLIRGAVMPAALLAVASAAPAWGQVHGGDGYLFGSPGGYVSVRAGYAQPGASSDLFAESFQTFSLQRRSLAALNLGAEVGVRLLPQLDLTVGAEYAGRSASSDYRHFYDNEAHPIEQVTTFQRVPITAGLKAYLLPPGRSIGTLAWIPASVVPWVGASAGMMYYRFIQDGDFIASADPMMHVYQDRLYSDGWGFATQAAVGVDVSLSARTALTADLRYTHSRAALDRSYFVGYNDLDLSGAAFALGLTFRL